MKIDRIDVQALVWPGHDPKFWMSIAPGDTRSELVVRVHTDAGIVGIGHADARCFVEDADGAVRPGGAALAAKHEFAPMLVGKDPLDNERLWSEMFAGTHRKGWSLHGWNQNDLMVAIAAVDIALWDVKGKAAGMPVYKLLGASRDRVPCYVAGGYYREGKSVEMLARECKRYADEGFPAVKMRVGGVSLAEDIERVQAVRGAMGPDVKLMLDANGAYDVETAIQAARAFAPSDIFWFEEPVHWYDEVDGPRRVTEATGIPIATGEHARTRWQARQLLTDSDIAFMQYDAMMSGGPTEWLKVAAMCSAFNIPMAPHHGPNIHAHLAAAVPNGVLVEYFPNPADYDSEEDLYAVRYDLMREAFSVFPEVVDGDMLLPDTPGWGFELDEDVVARRAVAW